MSPGSRASPLPGGVPSWTLGGLVPRSPLARPRGLGSRESWRCPDGGRPCPGCPWAAPLFVAVRSRLGKTNPVPWGPVPLPEPRPHSDRCHLFDRMVLCLFRKDRGLGLSSKGSFARVSWEPEKRGRAEPDAIRRTGASVTTLLKTSKVSKTLG